MRTITLTLTRKEANAVAACLSGEVENDDGDGGDYMPALRRVLRKIETTRREVFGR